MSERADVLAERVVRHLVEIAGGECSITNAEIAALAEHDEATGEILAGLYFLHQELVHRESERNEALGAAELAVQQLSAQNVELETGRLRLAELAAALSTPVIPIWKGVVMVPVVGALDAERAAAMTERLLTAIVVEKATWAIVDITGMDEIASATAVRLVSMMRSIHLLGARAVLAGANASVALAIVRLRVDLPDITTVRNVEQALKLAMLAP